MAEKEYIEREAVLRDWPLCDEPADAYQFIRSFPAADVVERKTGKWIPITVSSGRDSWQCSVCGRRARGKVENLPYCHCGAKMIGGDDDV